PWSGLRWYISIVLYKPALHIARTDVQTSLHLPRPGRNRGYDPDVLPPGAASADDAELPRWTQLNGEITNPAPITSSSTGSCASPSTSGTSRSASSRRP